VLDKHEIDPSVSVIFCGIPVLMTYNGAWGRNEKTLTENECSPGGPNRGSFHNAIHMEKIAVAVTQRESPQLSSLLRYHQQEPKNRQDDSLNYWYLFYC